MSEISVLPNFPSCPCSLRPVKVLAIFQNLNCKWKKAMQVMMCNCHLRCRNILRHVCGYFRKASITDTDIRVPIVASERNFMKFESSEYWNMWKDKRNIACTWYVPFLRTLVALLSLLRTSLGTHPGRTPWIATSSSRSSSPRLSTCNQGHHPQMLITFHQDYRVTKTNS